MARMLGFGQPFGGVMQTAFVVEDVRASIAHFQQDCGAGPFFLLDHFLGDQQTYRGAQSTADVAIAMGFIGHMQVELIQPLDDNPSVYRETVQQRGFGFHHFGIACEDVEAELPAYLARGHELAFKAAVPTGGSVAYLDSGSRTAPGFIELIPATPGMDTHFTAMWRASLDWDGSDPIRPFM